LCLQYQQLNAGGQLLSNDVGKISYSVNSVYDQNEWKIYPVNPNAVRIQFIFQSIQIYQAELRIFDTLETLSGQHVFDCVSCGSLEPPPFYSKTGSVTILISGVTGVSFTPSQFVLQYVCTTLQQTQAFNYISLKLNMGNAYIEPHRTKGLVMANLTQQWVIYPSVTGAQVIISLDEFSVAEEEDNCIAMLQIYDSLNANVNYCSMVAMRNQNRSTGFIQIQDMCLLVFMLVLPM
jgi:hypothetical protein